MEEFYHPPRTWKWLAPGVVAGSLVFWGLQLTADGGQLTAVGVWMVIIGMLVGVAAVVNLWRQISEHAAEMFRQKREAEMLTPLVSLAKSMRQMHPTAVQVLNRFGVKTSWGVKVDVERGERDWVLLDTDPSVHFGFIEYVLSQSKGRSLMPMGWFSEGSKKWDPDGLTDDREQYQALRKWMYARMMITEAHGNQPPHFLPPWNPQLVMEAMGLTGEQDLYQPDLSDGSRNLDDIPRSKSEMDKLAANGEPSAANNEPRKQDDGEALTEEEARALDLVREQYPKMAVETYRRLRDGGRK